MLSATVLNNKDFFKSGLNDQFKKYFMTSFYKQFYNRLKRSTRELGTRNDGPSRSFVPNSREHKLHLQNYRSSGDKFRAHQASSASKLSVGFLSQIISPVRSFVRSIKDVLNYDSFSSYGLHQISLDSNLKFNKILTASQTFSAPKYAVTNEIIPIGSNNQITSVSSSLDVTGGLLLIQMITGMIIGKNDTLQSSAYLSPDKEKILKLSELESKILPVLKLNEDQFDQYEEQEWLV